MAHPTSRLSRRVAIALVLLAVAAVLRAIVWIGVLPPWQGPDEPSHYAYVERLANFSYPNRDDPDGPSPALATSMLHTAFDYFRTHDPRRPFTATLRKPLLPEPPGISQQASSALGAYQYPPLYYAALVPLYRLPGLHTATSRLYAVRLGSALLGGVLVVLTFFLVRELIVDDGLALAGSALVSLPPMVSQASAICNADIGLAVACTGLAIAALRVARRGATVRRLLAVAALAAAAALTKPFGFVAAVTIAGGLLSLPLLARRTGRPILSAAVVTFAGAVGVFLVGLERYRLLSLTNIRFSLDYLWQFYFPRLPGMSDVFPPGLGLSDPVPAWPIWGQTGVGSFGWLSANLSIRYVKLGMLTVALAIVFAGVAYALGRREGRRWNGVLIGACALAVLLYILGLHAAEITFMLRARGTTAPLEGRILQGRYLIPVLPLGIAAVLAGARAWSRHAAVALVAVLLVVWFGISVVALRTAVSFYAT